MGAKVDFTSHIKISGKTNANGLLRTYGYYDLTDEMISQITNTPTIKFVQISEPLPQQAYIAIDKILEKREDMHFRIYGLLQGVQFDLSCLYFLKHLKHLTLDVHLKDRQDLLDLSVLTKLKNLQTLCLALFDLKDYSFIKDLSSDIEELCISADTMGSSIVFDCDWLKRYQNLRTLYLGQKARKHIEHIAELESLENLTVRGIKLKNFDFLRGNGLRSLSIHLCSMNDLTSLTGFDSLKSLELWRIARLEDISFIATLTGLEHLCLRDLKHITTLPDLSALERLQEIILNNVPIDVAAILADLQKIICKYR